MNESIRLLDAKEIVNSVFPGITKLANKTVLVTGATGLIGSSFVRALLYASKEKAPDLKILALVRNEDKAKQIFPEASDGTLQFLIGDVTDALSVPDPIHYIVHGACPTASRFFVEHPFETLSVATKGTDRMLQLAVEKQVEGFVYLSSMEVYGNGKKYGVLTEEEAGSFSPGNPRNSYPIGKLYSEQACISLAKETCLPITVLRMAQTFGPGVAYDDGRVFAEFARCAMEKTPIRLLSKGKSERVYLDVSDAVTAILTLLLSGMSGEIYNAANEETYCSISEMADQLANSYGISVEYKNLSAEQVAASGYSAEHHLHLSAKKIRSLGWSPRIGLMEIYRRMIQDFTETKTTERQGNSQSS